MFVLMIFNTHTICMIKKRRIKIFEFWGMDWMMAILNGLQDLLFSCNNKLGHFGSVL